MKQRRLAGLAVAALALLSTPTHAVNVLWTDWQNAPNSTSATGQIVTGSETIGVNYSGTSSHTFVQTGTGINYWTGTAYTNGVVSNAPPAAELIALNPAGTVTISFSKAVVDPLIGLVSWNGNNVNFGVPIQIDSTGTGFWGTGTAAVNAAGTGFLGNGELHGVIRVPGTHSSITFTHTTENWHGFTVGAVGLVPEPSTYAMLLVGLGLVGVVVRRKKIV